jgi:hypothetical protein
MSKTDSPIQQLLTGYWRDNGLVVSKGLLAHQEFLMRLTPTGDVERDIAAFLIGVGNRKILERYRQFTLPLRGLAAAIVDNHREELARIRNGEDPMWDAKYYRRNEEALRLYQHMLEIEEQVLSTILSQDYPRQAA